MIGLLLNGAESRYDSDMASGAEHDARPVFIVGSPRSGTSVLTWALGQHPNLLLTEESNWLGSFAIQAAAAHAQGSARGLRSQLGALGITRDDFLSGLGDAIDRMILAGRPHLEAASRATAQHSPQLVNPEFAVARDTGDAKTRWIDGTPEHSLQIHALIALFPKARFVHILRDADQIAASLLAFRDERGRSIVASVEEAYAYWMRTVQACVDAENILGPAIVHRVRYDDLIADSERTLRGVLNFLDEPFDPACLEPLGHRINSSFSAGGMLRTYPSVRSVVIKRARSLSAEWLESPQQDLKPDNVARAGWQVELETMVLYAQTLEANWEAVRPMLKLTRTALATSGMLLVANWLLALTGLLWSRETSDAVWLVSASVMVAAYAWLRRAGLRSIAARILGMTAHPTRKSG